MPIVVWVHGGGFRRGSKNDIRRPGPILEHGGYILASVEYRLSGEAIFPAAIADCKAAVRWLRANAAKYGIGHDAADSPESLFIGGPIQDHPKKAQKANPIAYVSADDPPMLLVHGDKDMSVPYNQSELLYAALQQAGVESRLYKVAGAGHGFRNPTKDTPESLFAMAAEFFDRHFKP